MSDNNVVRILFDDNDKLTDDDIEFILSKEEFKTYKRLKRSIEKLEFQISECLMFGDSEKASVLKNRLNIKKRELLFFKKKHKVLLKELEKHSERINEAFANGKRVVLPKIYMDEFRKLKLVRCKNCNTYIIVPTNAVAPFCKKCGTYST